MPIDVALYAVRRLLGSLSGGFLAKGAGCLDALERLAKPALLQGAILHDARIAALCIFHGDESALIGRSGFFRFPELAVANPLTKT